MSTQAGRTPPTPSGSQNDEPYRESLNPPWWWYPVAAAVGLVIAAEFQFSAVSLAQWLPFAVLIPLSIVAVWSLGRGRLTVTDEELTIRRAHISLRFVSSAMALDARTLRRVIGREGDPLGFVSIRPWIGPGVQLIIDDPGDPTPYWVISTRRPEQVAELIRRHCAGRPST